MGRRSIEFLANEEGDWFLHCHMLYHMDAGMARVISYRKSLDPTYEPAIDPALVNPPFVMLDGMLLSNMTMGHLTLMTGREDFGFAWDYGFKGHSEYEIDAYWSHHFDPNLSTTLGYRFTNEEHAKDRAFTQVNYRLPFLVDSFVALDSQGDVRVGLGKTITLTDRLFIFADVEYDTNTQWEYSLGASYFVSKEFSLTAGYWSNHGLGAGITFRF